VPLLHRARRPHPHPRLLAKRRDRFDHVLIETTGLADPGPVAQTFFADDEVMARYRLDGIVTVVDAKHLELHVDDSDECKEQIAFADVVIVNKLDLVSASRVASSSRTPRRPSTCRRAPRRCSGCACPAPESGCC
jgi:G3E family GTPase